LPKPLVSLIAACLVAGSFAPPARAQVDPDVQARSGMTVTRIDITGNKVTRDYVIRREIHTAAGAPLDPGTLAGDYTRLENLGVFGSIRIAAEDTLGEATLTVTVTEIPWIVPYPALSYSEVDGWSVGLGVASPNLLGRAITLSGSVLVGGTTQYSAAFLYPWITGNHVSAGALVAHLTREDVFLDFEEHSQEFTPEVGTWLGTHGRLNGAFSWFQMHSDVDGKTLNPGNTDNLFQLQAGLRFDTRDSWRDPRSGWLNEIRALNCGLLGGDGNFWSGILDVRRFQPGFSSHDLTAGVLLQLNSGTVGTDYPEYLQYHLGGANSVRGYDPEVLGNQQYGKDEAITTLEYEIPLSRIREYRFLGMSLSLGFKFAFFSDIALAWSRPEDAVWRRVQVGYGGGLRVLVPGLEMIRFEVGAGHEGAQIHFAALSKFDAQRNRLR